MKILILSPAYEPSAFGGIKSHVTDLARSLLSQGHEVTVCTTNAYNTKKNMPFRGRYVREGIEVYYFNNLFPRKYWFCPSAIPVLIRIVKQYSIVHMHNNYSFLNSIVFVLCKIYRIPYLFSAHGSFGIRDGGRIKKNIYNKLIGNRLVEGARRIVLLTNEEKSDYSGLYNSDKAKFEKIPNAINLGDFVVCRRRNKNRKTMRILYLGRLHRIKGLDILVKAFSQSVRVEPNLKLQIVGPDFGYKGALQKLIADLNLENSVELLKEVHGRDKISIFLNSDLFILTSRYDTFPMVILEACAANLPIIISKNCLISNMLKNNNAAIVTDCDDKAISGKIIALAKNSSLRDEISENAYRMVCNSYNWDKIGIRFAELYQSIVSEHGGGTGTKNDF